MSSDEINWADQRSRIIGLGDASARKSYYAELQKNVEDLKASEADLLTIFNSVHDAIFIHDFDGHVENVNDSMLRLFMVSKEEALRFGIADYCGAPESYERLRVIMAELRETGADQVFEWVARRPLDGSVFPVEIAIRRALWRGRPMVVAVVRDITERREAEAKNRRLEEQLSQLRKMETIGQLAGGVAHDFNNMLTPIMNYAMMLRDDFPKDDPRRADLEEIVQSSFRARDLTRQLLAFARQQKLALKTLNINQTIRNFERMLRRTLRENVLIELSLADDLEWIVGDVGQLEQILLNLAINGQDAMPDGGNLLIQTLNRRLSSSDSSMPAGNYVCLMVEDHGHGMDEQTKKRIFEPFFTTKGLGRGTGLGLSTVYGIVHQHGAYVEVDSSPGQGTRFLLFFPAHAQPSVDPVQSVECSGRGLSGVGMVLLVEDQDHVRASIRAVLERAGFEVLAARNGQSALELAQAHRGSIDLLVSDVIMEGMTGKDLQGRLALLFPHLRTLFISGYPAEVIGRHGVLESDTQFLSKPFSPEELIKACTQALATK